MTTQNARHDDDNPSPPRVKRGKPSHHAMVGLVNGEILTIHWRHQWYDGDESKWIGWVYGEKAYCVHRGSWWSFIHDVGDACGPNGFGGDDEGKIDCLQHLREVLGLGMKNLFGRS